MADLHLEKGSWYGMRTGQLPPPYDTRATLARLALAIEQTSPRIVLCVGDSFHDGAAAARSMPRTPPRSCVWSARRGTGSGSPATTIRRRRGNGAGRPASSSPAGRWCSATRRSRCRSPIPVGGVGPLPPRGFAGVRGRGLRRRCFLTDGTRLILPSYGAYAGGLNARDDAVAAIFGGAYDALAIGAASVHRLPVQALRRDLELAAAK